MVRDEAGGPEHQPVQVGRHPAPLVLEGRAVPQPDHGEKLVQLEVPVYRDRPPPERVEVDDRLLDDWREGNAHTALIEPSMLRFSHGRPWGRSRGRPSLYPGP